MRVQEAIAYDGSSMYYLVSHAMTMPDIDRDSRVPAWKQIAAQLRADIAAGRYGPDDPLPSISRLTQDYGVARVTAHKALAQLAAEGLTEVEPGMGYYVRAGHGEGTPG